MRRDEVTEHTLDPQCAKSMLGCDITYSLYSPVRCPCPATIVRINLDIENLVHDGQPQTLGNLVLDSSGRPYTIITYLDQNYADAIICDPQDNTTVCYGNNYEAVKWNHPSTNPPQTEILSYKPQVSVQHKMGAMRAMQPEVGTLARKVKRGAMQRAGPCDAVPCANLLNRQMCLPFPEYPRSDPRD